MKLYIPRIGDKVKLTENWIASIYGESRNQKVFDALGMNVEISYSTEEQSAISVTIPKGTVLSFSRIYLRSPASSFDSITFVVVDSSLKNLIKARFWVKATDASKIDYEHFLPSKENIKKFDELYNVTAREMGYDDLQQLDNEDKRDVIYEMIKQINPVKLNVDLTKKEVLYSIARKIEYNPTEILNLQNKLIEKIEYNIIPEEVNMEISIYPLLDKFVIKMDEKYYNLFANLNDLYKEEEKNKYRISKVYHFDNEMIIIDPKKEMFIGIPDIPLKNKLSISYENKKIEFEKVYQIESAVKKIVKPLKVVKTKKSVK